MAWSRASAERLARRSASSRRAASESTRAASSESGELLFARSIGRAQPNIRSAASMPLFSHHE